MAGFALALLGGAMKGWGTGQLEAIKAKREEKLRMLDQQFTREQNELNRGLHRKQIASTERLAGEQRKSNEMLTRLEIGSRETLAREGEAGATTRTQMQIDANKDLEQARIDAQADLNIKPVLQKDGSTVFMRGQEVLETPKDPKTGKPIDPAITDNDTDEMRNYKFLISVGVPGAQAQQLAFSAKNADPTLLKTSLIETFVKAQTTFGNANEETIRNANKWADDILGKMGITTPTGETPGAPSSAAETTDPNQIVIPKEWTDEQVRAAVNEALSGGADRAALKAAVQKNGRDPAKVGL